MRPQGYTQPGGVSGSLPGVQSRQSLHAAVGQRLTLSNRKPDSACTWWPAIYFYLHRATLAVRLGGHPSEAQAGCLTPVTLRPAQPTLPTC